MKWPLVGGAFYCSQRASVVPSCRHSSPSGESRVLGPKVHSAARSCPRRSQTVVRDWAAAPNGQHWTRVPLCVAPNWTHQRAAPTAIVPTLSAASSERETALSSSHLVVLTCPSGTRAPQRAPTSPCSMEMTRPLCAPPPAELPFTIRSAEGCPLSLGLSLHSRPPVSPMAKVASSSSSLSLNVHNPPADLTDKETH